MKKFVLAIASLGIVATAVPASAAPAPRYGHAAPGGWVSINQRQAQLEARINHGVRTRQLSMREAQALRLEFRRIAQLEARYRASRPGLTRAEMRDLDRRMDILSKRIAREVHDRNGRIG